MITPTRSPEEIALENTKAWIHWVKINPLSQEQLELAEGIEKSFLQIRIDALEEAGCVADDPPSISDGFEMAEQLADQIRALKEKT